MHQQQPPFQRFPQGPAGPPANPLGLDERTAASFAHLAFFVLPLLGPALILASSNKGQLSRYAAAHALVLQVTIYVCAFVGPLIGGIAFWLLVVSAHRRDAEHFAVGMQFVPLLLMLLPWILGVWGSVSAAIDAKHGIVWRMPLLGRIADRIAGPN